MQGNASTHGWPNAMDGVTLFGPHGLRAGRGYLGDRGSSPMVAGKQIKVPSLTRPATRYNY